MSEEMKKKQKQIVDEMMKVYETNPDVINYMEALMKFCIDLQQKVEQLDKENDDLKNRLDNEVAENTLRLKEVEQLENIRKEAIEYIENNSYFESNIVKTMVLGDYSSGLLNILNKGE